MVARTLSGRWLAPLVLGSLCAVPAAAQRFGQWWWEAQVTGSLHDAERLIDGDRISDVAQSEAKLALDLNGFVLHPAVGDFRLGFDVLFSQIEDDRQLDTERLGVRTDLSLFPRGRYPVRLYFYQQNSDHELDDGIRSSLLGLLDSSTRWGGRVRLRKGRLRGALIGLEHSALDFLDPVTSREIHDNQFVDWSRRGGKLKHHARLEHNFRSFSTVDLELDDLTLTLDQQGHLTPTWRWELSGAGVRREFTLGNADGSRADGSRADGSRADDYRLRSRLAHTVREDDLLDLRFTLGSTRAGSGVAADNYGLALFYRWRGGRGLEVAPFAEYQSQSVNGLGVRSPRAGVAASWNRQGKALDTLLSVTTSYGLVQRDGARLPADEEESSLAFAFSGSLAHGTARGLRKELEIELGRNDIELTPDPIFDLPDLGLPGRAVGTEDSYRARIRLGRRWQSLSLSAWSDWSLRESAGSVRLADFESETLSTNVQLGFRRFNVQASGGETRVAQEDPGDQKIRFLSARASWRPWRFLSLEAIYRADNRQFAGTGLSDVDGERLEAQLEFRLGLLSLKARGFASSERTGDGRELASKGMTLSLSRRLAGWLPVVTGTQRRGEIR